MFDPVDEVRHRYELAVNYLSDAEEALSSGRWKNAVADAAENAAKAVIAVYRIPSWSHDPSDELEELADRLGDLASLARELAAIARSLAPEHGRSTYGEPGRGSTPWELYSRDDAERAVKMARRAVEIMRNLLTVLGAM